MTAQRTDCLRCPFSRCVTTAIPSLTALQPFRFFFNITSRTMHFERQMHPLLHYIIEHRQPKAPVKTILHHSQNADDFHIFFGKAADMNNHMFFTSHFSHSGQRREADLAHLALISVYVAAGGLPQFLNSDNADNYYFCLSHSRIATHALLQASAG